MAEGNKNEITSEVNSLSELKAELLKIEDLDTIFEEMLEIIDEEGTKIEGVYSELKKDYEEIKKNGTERSDGLVEYNYGSGDDIKKDTQIKSRVLPHLYKYGTNVLDARRLKLDAIKERKSILKDRLDMKHKYLNLIMKFIKKGEGNDDSATFINALFTKIESKNVSEDIKSDFTINKEEFIDDTSDEIDQLLEIRKEIEDKEEEEAAAELEINMKINDDDIDNNAAPVEKWTEYESGIRFVLLVKADKEELLLYSDEDETYYELDDDERKKFSYYEDRNIPMIQPGNYEIEKKFE